MSGGEVSLVVYVAAVVFGGTSVLLFRRPRTAMRHPLALSTCVAIVLGALVFVCAAPATLATVNGLTGIPNFGAPLTYGMLSAYSCAVLVLLINWRGGPRSRVRRRVLRAMTAYGLLIAAIVVLFVLADADTERLTDLDTYYAGTPFMREMILLYLLGHSAAMLVMCAVCLRWGREVGGLLRAGLRLILLGALLDVVGFQLTKYTAVVARWTGHDLDFLSTDVAPPLAALAALLCAAGFVLPRLLPPLLAQWRGLDDHRRLRPLWSLVGSASTAPRPPAGWWQLPQARLQWREVSIHDALLALAPYFDHGVREAACAAALRTGRTPHEARVTAEAAMLVDAVRRSGAGEEPPPGTRATYRLHATEVSGASGLVELAEALHRPAEEGGPAAARGGPDGDAGGGGGAGGARGGGGAASGTPVEDGGTADSAGRPASGRAGGATASGKAAETREAAETAGPPSDEAADTAETARRPAPGRAGPAAASGKAAETREAAGPPSNEAAGTADSARRPASGKTGPAAASCQAAETREAAGPPSNEAAGTADSARRPASAAPAAPGRAGSRAGGTTASHEAVRSREPAASDESDGTGARPGDRSLPSAPPGPSASSAVTGKPARPEEPYVA